MIPRFGILVLAAGKSSRFGSDKLLAKMPDGRPLIAHSLEPLQSIAHQYKLDLCIVTRADNLPLIDYLSNKNIPYTLSSDAHLGMGHSLSHGVKCNKNWQGWMITLADMPNLTTSTLEALITTISINPHRIVRPSLLKKGKVIPSHPTYFPQNLGNKLSQLTGDNGAKHLIKSLDQPPILFNVPHPNSLKDVDTLEELQQLF